MGTVLRHHHGDHALGGTLAEQGVRDLLDHPRGGAFAHPDQHSAVADGLHVTALERGPAEVLRVEPPVVAERGVPVLEVGLGEHRVVAVDRGDVVGLQPPGRPEHRVDGHAAVDPARGVTREQRVRQRRQHEDAGVVNGGTGQGRGPQSPEVESGLGHGQPADEVPGELFGLEAPQRRPDVVDERQTDGVLRHGHLDQPAATLVAGRQRLAEQVLQQVDLDPSLPHLRDELVVLVLRALDPQHVVEQQVVVIGGCQPLQAQLGPVDHHLAQPPDLRVDPQRGHELLPSRRASSPPPLVFRPCRRRSPRCGRAHRSRLASRSPPRTAPRLRPSAPSIPRRTRAHAAPRA